eukprot:tig00000383_g24686.t2
MPMMRLRSIRAALQDTPRGRTRPTPPAAPPASRPPPAAARCLSFVDSRLCAVPGHLSPRRLPRRLPQLRRLQLQAMCRARRHLSVLPLPRPPPPSPAHARQPGAAARLATHPPASPPQPYASPPHPAASPPRRLARRPPCL